MAFKESMKKFGEGFVSFWKKIGLAIGKFFSFLGKKIAELWKKFVAYCKTVTTKQWINFGICVAIVVYLLLVILSVNHKIDLGENLNNLYFAGFAGRFGVRLAKTLVIAGSFYLVIQISNIFVNYSNKVKNSSVRTGMFLIATAVKYISIISIILLTLSAWGVNTTALIAGSSVIALVVGLGCQKLITDIVAGILILFKNDIKVGDLVTINGWKGTITQIGLTRTVIEDKDGNINFMNNSTISSIVKNVKEPVVEITEETTAKRKTK